METNCKVIVGTNTSDTLKGFPSKYKLMALILQAQGYKPVMFDIEGSEYESVCESLGVRRIVGPAEKLQKEIAELQESGVEIPVLDIDPKTELVVKKD